MAAPVGQAERWTPPEDPANNPGIPLASQNGRVFSQQTNFPVKPATIQGRLSGKHAPDFPQSIPKPDRDMIIQKHMRTARALLLTGACVLAAALPPAQAQVAGGWSDVSATDEGAIRAARFAVDAQQQAMKAAAKDDKLTLVKILSARQQVVAGLNYNLTLQVKVGEALKTAEATVWARLWLKGEEQYKLTSWKFADEKEVRTEGKQYVAMDQLPAAVKAAFTKEAKEAGDLNISAIEKTTEDGKVVFQADLATAANPKGVHVKIGEDGAVIDRRAFMHPTRMVPPPRPQRPPA